MSSDGKIIPEAVVRLRRLEDERRRQLHQLLTEVLEKGETNRLSLKRLHETRHQELDVKWELVQRAKMAFGESLTANQSTANTTTATTTGPNTTRTQSNSSQYSTGVTGGPTSMSWLKRVVQMKPKLFVSRSRHSQQQSQYHRQQVRVMPAMVSHYQQRPKSSYGIRSTNKVKPDFQSENEEMNKELEDIVSLDGLSIQDTDDEDIDPKRRRGLWSSKRWPSKPSVITLRFNGLTANCLISRRIQISQQLYGGGNAITIFDRMVRPGDNLTFNVRPHPDSAFSMTVLIDGIRDLRVSTCCEHKHTKGSKISHFTLIDVTGGKMCVNCRRHKTNADGNRVTKSLPFSAVKNGYKVTKNVDQINVNKDNELSDKSVAEDDDEDVVQTVIELDKQSQRSSVSSVMIEDINNSNDNQLESYESEEFEAESVDELAVRSSPVMSVSSAEDSDGMGHEVEVEVEVHNNP